MKKFVIFKNGNIFVLNFFIFLFFILRVIVKNNIIVYFIRFDGWKFKGLKVIYFWVLFIFEKKNIVINKGI